MITKKTGRDSETDNYRLDTSSLIDVGFLLLIYFLVTSTLDPREGDLELTVPDRQTGTVVPRGVDHPQIVVDANGQVFVGAELVDANPDVRELPGLEDRMKTYVEACAIMDRLGWAKVELDVDDSVPGQRLIDVMNCLTKVGIKNVMFDESWR